MTSSLSLGIGIIAVKLKRYSIVVAVALALCISSCNSENQIDSTDSSPNEIATDVEQKNSKKKVVTTFTILADMARNVGGDKLEVKSITRIGAEIHGYEPTPSDLTQAQDAELILYNGMNLERWFEQFYKNLGDVESVLLTEGIEGIPISEGPYKDKFNPHAWMSPKNALIYVENIRKAFVKIDPANADTYNTNAEAYSKKLQAIDRKLQEDLARLSPQQRYLVTCEGAFSYLARDYGLKEIYMWAINAESQSTPKQIQNVIKAVKANSIPTVFCESTVSSEGQKQVAKETGSRFGGNLYVDSLSTKDGPVPTFIDLLQYDAETITKGLLGK